VEYVFTVNDSFGDGFCCEGFAAVVLTTELGEDIILAVVGENFGFEATLVFLVSPEGEITRSPTPIPTTISTTPPSTRMPVRGPQPAPSLPPGSTKPPTSEQELIALFVFLGPDVLSVGFSIETTDTRTTIFDAPQGSLPLEFASQTVGVVIRVDRGVEFIFTMTHGNGVGLSERAAIFLGTEFDFSRVILYIDDEFGFVRRQLFLASEAGIIATTPATAMPSARLYPSSSPTLSSKPSVAPSLSRMPTVTGAPTNIPVPVLVAITLDNFPHETGWSIRRTSDGRLMEEVPFKTYNLTLKGTTVNHTIELPVDAEFIITFVDDALDGFCCQWGDGEAYVYFGWEARSDKILVYENGNFGLTSSHRFVTSESGVATPSSSVPVAAVPTPIMTPSSNNNNNNNNPTAPPFGMSNLPSAATTMSPATPSAQNPTSAAGTVESSTTPLLLLLLLVTFGRRYL